MRRKTGLSLGKRQFLSITNADGRGLATLKPEAGPGGHSAPWRRPEAVGLHEVRSAQRAEEVR
jgi:hypothetical protein